MHLLLLSLLLLLLPLLLPFHFSIARIADASHKRRLSTAIASAASASSRELDFLTRATADLESLALGERKPGVGTAAPRMIAECPRAVLPSMSLKTSSTGPHRRSFTISKPKSQALLLILVAHVSPWFVLQRRSADDGSASLLRPAALFAPGIPTHTHDEASMPQNLVDSPNAPGTKKLGIPALCAR